MNIAIAIQATEQVRVVAAPSEDDTRSALAGVNNRPIESRRDCGAAWRNMAAAALWSNAAVAHAMAPAVSHVVATIIFARVRGCAKGAIFDPMNRTVRTYNRAPIAIIAYRTGLPMWNSWMAHAQSSVLVAALKTSCSPNHIRLKAATRMKNSRIAVDMRCSMRMHSTAVRPTTRFANGPARSMADPVREQSTKMEDNERIRPPSARHAAPCPNAW